ncbi:unnamed protein product [marine sediment metagenome]|uniref:Uncharacterized protein n=1 Tax=marine sediment metagenome TaxID=412755 RepID=X1SM08_9ZZZZ
MEKHTEELINEILKQTFKEDNIAKLTCAKALAIAEQFTVEPREVGTICNEHHIKLCKCQLGCFS